MDVSGGTRSKAKIWSTRFHRRAIQQEAPLRYRVSNNGRDEPVKLEPLRNESSDFRSRLHAM